jgi:DNA-binding LacI/PurR family transcriptional regulator
MAVIKDVSNLAGVSVGTVSKYLNNPDKLKLETKLKVEQAINTLQYKPSSFARSMRTRKSYSIAIIVPTLINPYFVEVFNAIKTEASGLGYTPIIFSTEDKFEFIQNYVTGMAIGQVDGIILFYLNGDEAIYKFLLTLKSKIPIVNISWDINNTDYDSAVVVDVAEGIYNATKHLIDLGHQKIAFVGGPENHRNTREKYNGYAKAMRDFRYPIKSEYVYFESPNSCKQYKNSGCCLQWGNSSPCIQMGYLAARYLTMLPDPPDAIVTSTDILAIGCLKYCIQKNIKIPEDIAVIGYDNISLAEMYEPSLSTVAMPLEKMGKEAMKLITSKINKRRIKPRQIILNSQVIIRKSTDKNVPIEL